MGSATEVRATSSSSVGYRLLIASPSISLTTERTPGRVANWLLTAWAARWVAVGRGCTLAMALGSTPALPSEVVANAFGAGAGLAGGAAGYRRGMKGLAALLAVMGHILGVEIRCRPNDV